MCMDLMSWWLHSPRRWPAESSGARHKGQEPLVMVPRSVTYGLPMVPAHGACPVCCPEGNIADVQNSTVLNVASANGAELAAWGVPHMIACLCIGYCIDLLWQVPIVTARNCRPRRSGEWHCCRRFRVGHGRVIFLQLVSLKRVHGRQLHSFAKVIYVTLITQSQIGWA